MKKVPGLKDKFILVKMNTIEEVIRSARSGETEEQSIEKLKQLPSNTSNLGLEKGSQGFIQ